MPTTQYIGSRYVPLLADPVEWSNTKEYEPLTIVTHEGNSYTSRQFVPKGIDIADDEYWALTGNYNAQIEQYRRETQQAIEETQQAVQQINDWYDSAVAEYADKYGAKPFAFDTVSQMQRAYSLLYVGAFCRTSGFNSVGDGGAAWYRITDTGTANGKDVIACGALFANLVVQPIVTLEMFGCVGVGFGETPQNYGDNIQRAFDWCESNKAKVLIDKRFGTNKTLYANCDIECLYTGYIVSLSRDAVTTIEIGNNYDAVQIERQNKTITLNVDANGLSALAVKINRLVHSEIRLFVLDFTDTGVDVGGQSAGNNENYIVIGYQGLSNAISDTGVYLHGSDNNIEHIYGHDTLHSIRFHDTSPYAIGFVHTWISPNRADLLDVADLLYFDTYIPTLHINNLYADTIGTLANGNFNALSGVIKIDNLQFITQRTDNRSLKIWNDDVYSMITGSTQQDFIIDSIQLLSPSGNYPLMFPNITSNFKVKVHNINNRNVQDLHTDFDYVPFELNCIVPVSNVRYAVTTMLYSDMYIVQTRVNTNNNTSQSRHGFVWGSLSEWA